MHAMLTRQLLVVLGLIKVAGSDVVERPTHQVVRVGQDVRFHCRSDNPNDTLRWDYKPEPKSQQIQLYNSRRIHKDFSNRYSVSNLTDTHRDLDIRSVQPSDAGTYVCFKAGENGSFAATLVVLESEPKCWESRTPGPNDVMYSEVECKVSYAGDWPPSFRCVPPATNQNDSSTDRGVPHSVTYRQRLVTGRTGSADVTECSMFFDYNYLPSPSSTAQKFEYDKKPVEFVWKSPTFASTGTHTSTPPWVIVVAVIAAIIGVVQLFLLARFCARKFKPKFNMWRRRLQMSIRRTQTDETSSSVVENSSAGSMSRQNQPSTSSGHSESKGKSMKGKHPDQPVTPTSTVVYSEIVKKDIQSMAACCTSKVENTVSEGSKADCSSKNANTLYRVQEKTGVCDASQGACCSATLDKGVSDGPQDNSCSGSDTKDPSGKCKVYEQLKDVDSVPIAPAMYARIIQRSAHAMSGVSTTSANEYIELLDTYK